MARSHQRVPAFDRRVGAIHRDRARRKLIRAAKDGKLSKLQDWLVRSRMVKIPWSPPDSAVTYKELLLTAVAHSQVTVVEWILDRFETKGLFTGHELLNDLRSDGEEVFKLLVREKVVDPTTIDDNGDTVLHVLARKGLASMANFVLDSAIDFDFRGRKNCAGEDVMFCATVAAVPDLDDVSDMIILLLEHKFSLETYDGTGRCPVKAIVLQDTLFLPKFERILMLIDLGADFGGQALVCTIDWLKYIRGLYDFVEAQYKWILKDWQADGVPTSWILLTFYQRNTANGGAPREG
jgi:hypothetical protein